MKKLRILPEVAADIAEAADWYDANGYKGLGDHFIRTFRFCLPHILENGEIHRLVHGDYRKISMRPFPYFIFYRYHGDLLVVTLVIGAVRRPTMIRRKLQSRGNL